MRYQSTTTTDRPTDVCTFGNHAPTPTGVCPRCYAVTDTISPSPVPSSQEASALAIGDRVYVPGAGAAQDMTVLALHHGGRVIETEGGHWLPAFELHKR